jgi:hypothetical protein
MVAYSFQAQFVPQIQAGIKTHTVRGKRDRHARVGEFMQLYFGMRTKLCRKIIADPICTSVRPIIIHTHALIDAHIATIAIDGVHLDHGQIEAFARADGFAPEHCLLVNVKGQVPQTARENMGLFWVAAHGYGRFEGMLIEWSPA